MTSPTSDATPLQRLKLKLQQQTVPPETTAPPLPPKIPRLSPEIEQQLVFLEETIGRLGRLVEAELPPEIHQQHWRRKNTSPAAWRDTQAASIGHIDITSRASAALSLRVMLANFAGTLNAELMVIDKAGTPLNLKLAKVRRT